jgi:hypothetical protein
LVSARRQWQLYLVAYWLKWNKHNYIEENIQVMGNICCGDDVEGPHVKYWVRYRADFESKLITRADIKVLHTLFHTIETAAVNPDSSVLIETALHFFPDKLVDHKFMLKAFGIYSKNGRLTFRQFVHAVYIFCWLTHICLVRFAFDLYNPENKKRLELAEVRQLIHDLHGHIPDKDVNRYT